MLLRVRYFFYLTTERLKDGLEVRIDYELRHRTELVIVKLKLRLFRAGRRKHMKHRHEFISCAQLFIAREAFFYVKISESAKTDLVLMVMFGEIVK